MLIDYDRVTKYTTDRRNLIDVKGKSVVETSRCTEIPYPQTDAYSVNFVNSES